MDTSRFVWRFPDLIPFFALGLASFALPFVPFLNQPGVVLVAYLVICALACFFLLRFPADTRPDRERDEVPDGGGASRA